MDVVLIPAYEPDEQLIPLTRKLRDEGFSVVVVDDGSGRDYAHIFAAVQQDAAVLTHEKNRGKGAALKTGMRYIRDKLPDCEYFITCDADGQHRVEDVLRVQEKLHSGQKFVLTVRRSRKGIPLRSKVGNVLSRIVYALLAKRYLSDNQSGLRGFARVHIDWMLEVEKSNYDYEMNVLYYAAKKGIYVATLPIDAIYIDNNQSSHFNPVKDTLRIYRSLFRLAVGSIAAFCVSELLALAVSLLFGYEHLMVTLPSVGGAACLTNIVLSQFLVFRKTRCYDQFLLLVYAIIEYFIYTLGCTLCMYALPGLPLWISFNLVYLAGIPLRYLLHKAIFIVSKTRE